MIRALTSFLGLISLLTLPVHAATSDWVSVLGGAVRLISSGPPENGAYRAGLEFSLDPGWHTYWRFPGEAGIPPQIDLSMSTNVASAEVKYPTPGRYHDGFSTSIVYHDAVVLPIIVKPENPEKGVTLSASIFFGICKDICVPGDAAFEMQLAPDARVDKLSETLIDRDLALVPQVADADNSEVLSISGEAGEKAPLLIITAQVSGVEGNAVDLFAEGPEGSYIGVPVLRTHDGKTAEWSLSTRGLARTDDGSSLTLVLVDGPTAVESLHNVQPGLLK